MVYLDQIISEFESLMTNFYIIFDTEFDHKLLIVAQLTNEAIILNHGK